MLRSLSSLYEKFRFFSKTTTRHKGHKDFALIFLFLCVLCVFVVITGFFIVFVPEIVIFICISPTPGLAVYRKMVSACQFRYTGNLGNVIVIVDIMVDQKLPHAKSQSRKGAEFS
jgi:hypothetical protein